jgi:hypothetical protein
MKGIGPPKSVMTAFHLVLESYQINNFQLPPGVS